VALILDVRGLAQMAGLFDASREKTEKESGKVSGLSEEVAERQTLLIFRNGKSGRMAVELSLVARLEEFRTDIVERSGERELVQYRGKILPLVHVRDVLQKGRRKKEPASIEGEKLQVVVYTEGERAVGLVVDQILDIVEEKVVMEHPAERAGVRGTAVIQKKVTDMLDVKELLRLGIAEEVN